MPRIGEGTLRADILEFLEFNLDDGAVASVCDDEIGLGRHLAVRGGCDDELRVGRGASDRRATRESPT